jgi:hypothetical protein
VDDRFEATFVVQTPPRDVWNALSASEAAREDGTYWLPGFEASVSAIEVDEGRRLRARKDTQPCEGTEIVVTLEAVESGTKVTVVQSGFGPWFDSMAEWLEIGWSHIVADLHLFLERGIVAQRHFRPWASLGCAVREVGTGLEVVGVDDAGFAAQAGLARGDVVLTVGGAPVVSVRELATVMRVFRQGEKVEASWARGDTLLLGSGVL